MWWLILAIIVFGGRAILVWLWNRILESIIVMVFRVRLTRGIVF